MKLVWPAWHSIHEQTSPSVSFWTHPLTSNSKFTFTETLRCLCPPYCQNISFITTSFPINLWPLARSIKTFYSDSFFTQDSHSQNQLFTLLTPRIWVTFKSYELFFSEKDSCHDCDSNSNCPSHKNESFYVHFMYLHYCNVLQALHFNVNLSNTIQCTCYI